MYVSIDNLLFSNDEKDYPYRIIHFQVILSNFLEAKWRLTEKNSIYSDSFFITLIITRRKYTQIVSNMPIICQYLHFSQCILHSLKVTWG